MKTIAQQLNVKEFPFIIRDKNNNKLYFENSDGFWEKFEYDKNNNELYVENSKGFWAKLEFDKNNNEVYFENSYGKIIDNRPKKETEIIDDIPKWQTEMTISELEKLTGISNLKIVK
jgi:hypothetical protein